MPDELSDKIVVNTGNSVMTKEIGEGNSTIKVAPGEGMVPSNILREENFDVKAFPKHYPSGKFGLHFKRKQKLSPQMYFTQRLLNRDDRFARDPCFLFMASYYIERFSLERYINISGQKGKSEINEDGENKIHLVNEFDVFKQVKGSPKYWQVARNELVAKVKQLGPFHLFYTFSCGEMR